ncbi:MAG: GGDEF domain-containing protein [Oscillospiraceae bacterium]|nr:GGDEF domain-containing protein [Oscillospiraceae bacterium]
MQKNENSNSSASQIIGLAVYTVAYLAIWYFLTFKLQSIMGMGSAAGGPPAGVAGGPPGGAPGGAAAEGAAAAAAAAGTAAEMARKSAIMSATSGVLSQIQVLLSAFIVLGAPKKGFINAIVVNLISLATCIFKVVALDQISSLPGAIIPASTIILVSIITAFSTRLSLKNAELSKNYEQLMDTNRIIREKDEKLSYLAYYDILTSLPNRHLFIEKIDETIVNNNNMPFTVVLADIDNFKMINNTYGSSSGDVLLATYAEKFKTICGDSVFLGRIGGNEYGFILQGNMSEANILNFIEKIQNVLSEPVQIGSDIISATASYGIASYPNNAVSSSDILNCVNSAVSYAKSNGKNRPCFYEQY